MMEWQSRRAMEVGGSQWASQPDSNTRDESQEPPGAVVNRWHTWGWLGIGGDPADAGNSTRFDSADD